MNVEDFPEGEYERLTKRCRSFQDPSPSPVNQWSSGDHESPIQPLQYNPMDEPSPLGLRLRKSESFLELIQMRLSQRNTASLTVKSSENLNSPSQKDAKGTTTSGPNDKLKASNFPASLLSIGSWEYVSRYENDLVVKCYFAKHKLVWEVLEGGLKSKIEIQWSDITALKASCPDNRPGTLTVVLARQPIFFKETNPQPRKHTIWKPTSDFTDGQASINRKHFLRCPPGVLNKHYEKLIQCDRRLYILSRQLEIVIDSPYFEAHASVLKNPEESRGCEFDSPAAAHGYSSSGFQDVESAAAAQSSPLSFGQNPMGVTVKHMSREEAPSPSSVMDTRAIEWNGTTEGHGFFGAKKLGTTGDKASELWDVMENIKQDLLSDTQCAAGLDEESLLKKVDSLCCLLQDPATSSSAKVNEAANCGIHVMSNLTKDSMHEKTSTGILASQENYMSAFGGMQVAPSMSRIDSFGEFVLHLPRIASLSEF
ncbi:hypothetical protein Adt_46041 [Abeliophyllum distichum]|uniref:TRF2/HOY1 PH-like domain-containing protein n=1 Tax=Abeliophyllum distichum TaxID=126358 RepID=A0ABD1P3G3_9LAMI